MNSDSYVVPHPDDELEPILKPENGRFAMYPIQHNDLYQHYKKMEEVIWNAQKLDFTKDYLDFMTDLNPDQQLLAKNFSEIFAIMDGYISEIICINFSGSVSYLEAKILYGLITHVENVHNETYSIMRETLIPNESERASFIKGVSDIPIINKLKSWLGNWMAPHVSFVKKLVVQAFFEGVILLTLFTIPYQFKKIVGSNKLPGFIRANEYINRDEIDHRDTGILIYNNKIVKKLQDSEIYEIATETINILDEMIQELFNVNVIGLNPGLMKEHAQYLADFLMGKLGVTKPLFGIKATPLTYMATVGLEDDHSFFEVEVTNYRDSDISNKSKTINWNYDGFF